MSMRLTHLSSKFCVGRWRYLSAAAVLWLLTGCSTLGYYTHVGMGQLNLMRARVPVSEVAQDPSTAPRTRQQLQLARQMMAFAQDHLQLPGDGRYAAYVELQRPYVVWNVFAAGPLSLDTDQWCYPVVGCAPYRGYFSEQAAQRAAQRFSDRGREVYVGGVPAYSTLGWFDDPLLSTFLHWPESDLAALLFHELAHSKIWVDSDVAFNESFATFVARQGLHSWHETRGSMADYRHWLAQRAQWQRLSGLLVQAKQVLSEIYADESGLSEQGMLAAKAQVLADLQRCYHAQRPALGAGRYDALMQQVNNAFLLSVGTYNEWVPAFAALFERVEGEWVLFYDAVNALADLSEEDRLSALRQLAPASASAQQHIDHAADDDDTQQVHCEALAGHGLHAEATR